MTMKNAFTLMSVAAFALAVPSGVVAAEKKTAATKAADSVTETTAKVVGEAKPLPMNARADVIDTKAKTFTMKRKDGVEVKHVVTDKTEIKNGEAAAKLSDIKVGEYVSGLRLKKSDTEYEVVKITKFGPPAPKKPKAEAEAKPAEKKTN
jgi:hypothetical protein